MTYPNNTGVQGSSQGTDNTHRAPYADYLEQMPEDLRPIVEPVFKEWDSNVTKRFQGVQSEYEPYKPFVDKYEPAYIEQATQLAEALESDPAKVIQALQEAYPELFEDYSDDQGADNNDQGTEGQQAGGASEYQYQDPRFDDLRQQTESLAQHIQEQNELRAQEEADRELAVVMSDLHERHGNFDDRFVLSLMAQGTDPDEAAEAFNEVVKSYAQQQIAPTTTAPTIVGAGGGLPTTQQDPALLDSRGTKNLVAELLARANAQQG